MKKYILGFLIGLLSAYIATNYKAIENQLQSWTQTKNVCTNVGPFKLIRYGVEKDFSFNSCDSLDKLIERARTTHNDATITRFTTLHGINVSDTSEITGDFVALHDNEHFIWQPRYPGHKTDVLVDGHLITVETVTEKPRLFKLINLLAPEECDEMIAFVQSLTLVKSTIGETAELGVYDNVIRTSTNTWIGPSGGSATHPLYTRVRERIVNLTRLKENTAEDVQVVHYGIGEHFFVHHDYNDPNNCATGYCRGGGNRIVTVLFYLNDVEEGGETTFPYANNSNFDPYKKPIPYSAKCGDGGVWVKPKKGDAVMFYSLQEKGHMEGKVDPYSLHAGCDVVKGEKWAANLWIRNKRVNGKLIDDNW